jgi:outer membrane lipoprotein-sorting protein
MNLLSLQYLPLIIGVLLILIVLIKKEKFAQIEFIEPLQLKNGRSKHSVSTIISNGEIQYFFDGKHNYQLFFNLPIIGSPFQVNDLNKPFNITDKIQEYSVIADNSDKGTLKRQGNGSYELTFSTESPIKNIQVKIGNSVVESVDF